MDLLRWSRESILNGGLYPLFERHRVHKQILSCESSNKSLRRATWKNDMQCKYKYSILIKFIFCIKFFFLNKGDSGGPLVVQSKFYLNS